VAGIAGMIAGSIADNNGAAMTAGIVTAVAVLCLIVTTAVTGGADVAPAPADAEALAEHLESQIQALAHAGADEQQLRVLAGTAVKLGETRR
jgi:hypothetical protein